MTLMPKDETIKKWIKSFGSKKALEEEMLRRLDFVETDYTTKKSKLQYILTRLKNL
jgi:hypothetical protein